MVNSKPQSSHMYRNNTLYDVTYKLFYGIPDNLIKYIMRFSGNNCNIILTPQVSSGQF